MTSVNIITGAGAGSEYDDLDEYTGGRKLVGAYFNKSTYLEAQSGLLIEQSYTYTLSFWYKTGEDLPNPEDGERPIFTVQDCRCFLNGLKVWFEREEDTLDVHLNVLASAQDQAQQSIFSVADIPSHDDTWHHVAIYETSYPAVSRVYIDGVLQTLDTTSSITRDVQFSFGNQWRVAAGVGDEVTRYNGCLDEVYFTFDDFDIGTPANLDKLIDVSTGYARWLGSIGERPTGFQATVYLKDECEDFYINYGSLPAPYTAYGDLPCCDEIDTEPPINCGQIFEDPNKPCGWILRNPQVTIP